MCTCHVRVKYCPVDNVRCSTFSQSFHTVQLLTLNSGIQATHQVPATLAQSGITKCRKCTLEITMGTVARVFGGRQGNLAESWSLHRSPCISESESLILHYVPVMLK